MHATTETDVHALLRTLTRGDRVDLAGDRWRVIKTTTNDLGTPFVTLKAITGYHPGTRTVKPGSDAPGLGPVSVKSHGLPTYYPEIELVARHRTR